MQRITPMKVAIVHDDLVQWGGAERVLLGLCELYPNAPIYTSVYDLNNKTLNEKFKDKKIVTTFLQKIPFWKNFYRVLLPLYPVAFEQFDFSEFDLVISQTTRFAKNIITKPTTKHISYVHTPPRFLWNLSGEKLSSWLSPMLSQLRIIDVLGSRRVDGFIAGSENSKQRIKKIYKRDAAVVVPFADVERFKEVETFDGGYFVVIARLNYYKRVDIAIKACQQLNLNLKIIGSGTELENLKSLVDQNIGGIEFLNGVDDIKLTAVLAGCKALLIPGVEDFGLTSLEAQALGKPVIAFKSGGAKESVIEGKTGFFFDEQTVESLSEVLKRADIKKINAKDCRDNAKLYSEVEFLNKFRDTIRHLI